uniref:Uncharacterized protein n=1 Tax=Aegilops tauschii subsp. strangulata TaxID=200361 RepID=A0A453KVK0_AEGTS
ECRLQQIVAQPQLTVKITLGFVRYHLSHGFYTAGCGVLIGGSILPAGRSTISLIDQMGQWICTRAANLSFAL